MRTDAKAFFKELASLPPQQQAKKVRVQLTKDPELQTSKEFIDWGIKFAEVLR